VNVDLDCHQAKIDTIEPGTIFAAAIGGETTYCLAIKGDREGDLPSLLTLWPGHPGLKNRVGVLVGSVISQQPLLVYRTARIVPSPNPEHLDLESYRAPPAGALILVGDQYFIQAATGVTSARPFSCSDGEASSMHALEDRIVFTSWEVMIDGPGGDPYTLCVIDAKRSSTDDVFR